MKTRLARIALWCEALLLGTIVLTFLAIDWILNTIKSALAALFGSSED